MSERVREDSYQDAEEFLHALRMSNEQWNDQWVYRGHGDAEWGLWPTAFRKECWTPFGEYPKDHFSKHTDMAQFELDELRLFAVGLDRGGHAIPGISRQEVEELRGEGLKPRQWIRKLADLMALAQHHGLPTRLLDFSHSSLVAAYFAALPVRGGLQETESLCVWALCSSVIDTAEFVSSSDERTPWCQVVHAGRSGNERMVAQDGTFVVWEDETIELSEVVERIDPEPYREFVKSEQLFKGPSAIKLKLPRSQASRLLVLLAKERITGARMFPGPGGVIRERLERTRHGYYAGDIPAICRWQELNWVKPV